MFNLQERIVKVSLELLQATANDQVLDGIVRKQNARGDKALAIFYKSASLDIFFPSRIILMMSE